MRWGIVGTGYIANRFADGMQHQRGAQTVAVASRDMQRARAFARTFHIDRAFGNYEALAADPEIDIVYVGTPNSDHFQTVSLFLRAGKHVLCEKPMCVNSRETKALLSLAQAQGLFLMEGMWTRFFPAVRQAKRWLDGRFIGEPRMLTANFGIDSYHNPNQWRFDYNMAGGSLMDVGIYTIAMALMMFGCDLESVQGAANVEHNVDLYEAVTLKYKDGRIAMLGSGLAAKLDNRVVITGSKGCIVLGNGCDWWRANRAELILTGDDDFACNGERTVFVQEYPSFGFQYEIQAVDDCVRAGLREAPEIPHAETLRMSMIMENLLDGWGIRYRDSL